MAGPNSTISDGPTEQADPSQPVTRRLGGTQVDAVRSTRLAMVTFIIVAAVAVLAAVPFVRVYRPWHLRWGATNDELARTMPGDEIVTHPVFNATRAVTVNAQPEDIWPWIVQIGFYRGGWYTYDLLDNPGRRSAERIVLELQHIAVGDLIPMGPGKSIGIWVKQFVPKQWMVWWGKKAEQTSWTWVLDPMPEGTTRLITRVRAPLSWREPASAAMLVMLELADFPMMRKCLLGIKRRAEALASGSGHWPFCPPTARLRPPAGRAAGHRRQAPAGPHRRGAGPGRQGAWPRRPAGGRLRHLRPHAGRGRPVRDERGARSVPAAVTHAVFSADAAEVIDGSPLVSLLVTDSVEGHPPTWPACYQVVSAAPLLTEAIRRVQRRDSISVLFEA